MNRYEWEDALVDSQQRGEICNGALLVALKLAKAINWSPTNGRPAGLYWDNDNALRTVGAGRSTFYKYQKSLVETGFMKIVGGNVIPCLPPESTVETLQSTVETLQSTVETPESTVETGKSTGDNTLSVDIFTVDTFSEEHRVLELKEEESKMFEEVTPGPTGPVDTNVISLPLSTNTMKSSLSHEERERFFRNSRHAAKPVCDRAKQLILTRDYEPNITNQAVRVNYAFEQASKEIYTEQEQTQ